MVDQAKPPTPEDLLRLQQGDEALALDDPTTPEEAAQYLQIVRDGIIALQSVQDLGSDRANDLAWRNLQTLEAKYRRLLILAGVH